MKFRALSGLNRAVIFSVVLAVLVALFFSVHFYYRQYHQRLFEKNQQLQSMVQEFESQLQQHVGLLKTMQTIAHSTLNAEESSALNQPANPNEQLQLQVRGNLYGRLQMPLLEQKVLVQIDNAFQVAQSTLVARPHYYYLSSNHFVYTYPNSLPVDWRFTKDLYRLPLWVLGKPSANTKHRLFTTLPYRDVFTSQWSIALGMPVVKNGILLGNILLEVPLQQFSERSAEYFEQGGMFLLVDERDAVVVHPSYYTDTSFEPQHVEDVLPTEVMMTWKYQIAEHDYLETSVGDYYVKSEKLNTLPWRVVYFEKHHTLLSFVLSQFSFQFTYISVVLILVVLLLYMLTRRLVVRPTQELLHYINECSRGNVMLPERIPAGWDYSFERIQDAFEQNQELLRVISSASSPSTSPETNAESGFSGISSGMADNAAMLASIINAIPDLISFKDKSGAYLGCNAAFARLVGRTEDGVIGKRPSELIIGGEGIEIEEQDARVLVTGKAERAIRSLAFGHQEARVFDVLVTPFYSDQGELLGLLGIARDMTAQQEAVEALRQSEIKFRSAIEYSANGIILTDLEANIVQTNKALKKMLGYSYQQLEDQNLKFLFPLDVWQDVRSGLNALLQDESATLFREFEIHGALGRAVWMQVSASLILDPQQQPIYFVLHFRDDTEQKHYQDQLESAKNEAQRADAAKGEFMANMSHEIRTPMNAIIGMMQMLQESGLSSVQADHVEKAMVSANALLTIINDILDYSKAEAGKLQLDLVAFELDDVIKQSFVVSAFEARSKKLMLEMDIDPKLNWMLLGDKARLSQILINLINNAVKFTDTGRISVSVEVKESYEDEAVLCFAVQDTGIGIPAEKQSQLFEAFTQGDSSMTRKYGGTGLGLSICRQLVELMHGRIWFDSVPGEGSTFYFTVRLQKGSETTPVQELAELVIIAVTPENRELLITKTFDALGVEYYLLDITSKAAMNEYQPPVGRDSILIVQQYHLPQYKLMLSRWLRDKAHKPNIQYIASASDNRPMFFDDCEHFPHLQRPFSVKQLLRNWNSHEIVEMLQRDSDLSMTDILKNKKVLIAEDNFINQEVISSILSSAGIEGVTVGNGQEALELLASTEFDAVLLDIQMPVMDGITTIKKIRENPAWRNLPVVALTAHASTQDKAQSLQAGMNAHITKPVQRQEILSVLCQLVKSDKEAAQPAINMSFALGQFGGNEESLMSILRHFKVQLNKSAKDILHGCEQQEWKDVARKLHSLKGMSGNLGAFPLSDQVKRFEEALKAKQDPEQYIEEFESEIEKALSFLDTLE